MTTITLILYYSNVCRLTLALLTCATKFFVDDNSPRENQQFS